MSEKSSLAVRLSVWFYRRLLVAYPVAFRREYGEQLLQLFRDCCGQAVQAQGAAGLWRYWLLTLGDLISSAFAERRHEGVHMSRLRWIQLGSLAGLVGGSTTALVAALGLMISVLPLLDATSFL